MTSSQSISDISPIPATTWLYGDIAGEWWPNKYYPAQPGKRLQQPDDPRHEPRFSDQIADQYTPDSKKREIRIESLTAQAQQNKRQRIHLFGTECGKRPSVLQDDQRGGL